MSHIFRASKRKERLTNTVEGGGANTFGMGEPLKEEEIKRTTPKFEVEEDLHVINSKVLEDVAAESGKDNPDAHTDDDREPESNYAEEELVEVVATMSPTATPPTDKVLALLYPPGLMGGYRNQVIRLLSLVLTAMKRDIPALLLPSLLWTTQIWLNDTTPDGEWKETWVPIPHDLIFDVDHWNTFSDVLPRLVREDSLSDPNCWTHALPPVPSNATALTKAVLDRGFLTPLAKLSHSLVTRTYITNLRKLDVYKNVTDCTSPQVYGGGSGAGRLWRDYINLQAKNQSFRGADANILRALRPKQKWRELAQTCVSTFTENNYVALHARMELEMMDHACGRSMERNLTRLFEHVESLVRTQQSDVGGVFVAVSRSGIDMKEGNLYEKYKVYADENLEELNRVVGDGTDEVKGQGLGVDGSTAVVFECGKHLMDKYYAERSKDDTMDYGSLLQSVVNFYIATEAKSFIGVRGSSYSTDIWTTRYHQGKGESNYEYTKDGIIKLSNGGLPSMHTNCGKKK
jgi:hypothetical protein